MISKLASTLWGRNAEAEALKASVFPGEQRLPTGLLCLVVTLAGVVFTLFTLYMAFHVTPGPIPTRAAHLLFALPLTFLLYPASASGRDRGPGWIDYALVIASIATFSWAIYSTERFEDRIAFSELVETPDLILGIIAIVVVFEAARRTVGMAIFWITLAFFVYALTGPYWPGMLEHKGRSLAAMIEQQYMIPDGLFNFIMGIMATFLFTFLAFGAFLRVSGGDRVFNDFAMALAGHRRGGPAKVAVISSSLMGMLSGSTVSNVATTGTMTIPLMKRTGFASHEAAAIETVASLGGALMPPVMGAGVFLMAAFTGVPLVEILLYSTLPAILYYVSLYFYVDVKARKKNLVGLPREGLPSFLDVVKTGWHIFIPLFVMIFLLLIKYTPFFASSACVILIYAVSFLRRETALGPVKLIVALEASARIAITVSSLSAAAAIIFGVITATGLLVKMTSIILAVTGGSLFLGIVFICAMSYVLGMGLPVTASYVLVAALGAPALGDLGLPILAAHLIIFWFSQDSTITPPVAMTAYVAARIADAPFMPTAWMSVALAKSLYIIPFAFAYGSLLDESIVEIVFDFAVLFLTFALMPLVVDGYWNRSLSWTERLVAAMAAVLAFVACVGPMTQGLPWLAAALAAAALGWALMRRPAPQGLL